MTRPVTPLVDRWHALAIVRSDSECWGWRGIPDRDGYGHLGVWLSRDRWSMRGAHVVAWELVNGPVPKGHVVHHECENKSCVNPWHLELMKRADHQRMHTRREWCGSGLHRLADEQLLPDGRRVCGSCATIRARMRYRQKHGISNDGDAEVAAFLAGRRAA